MVCPRFSNAPPAEARDQVSRVDAVFQGFPRFEGYGVACLDFYRLSGLWVLASSGAAMALQKRAKAYQRDTVLAVLCASDFFENGIENAIGLFFGEIRFFSNSGCNIWFTHMKPL